MIWIIGGTSETADFLQLLKKELKVVVTVATETAGQFLAGVETVVERMNQDRMADFIRERQIETIVDLSHPYATEVTENAKKAARRRQIEYYRYVREKSECRGGIVFSSFEACRGYLDSIRGTVFFTIGSKHIADFQAVRNDNRFVYRVLPTVESIEECMRNGVEIRDIVAAVGPFSKTLNRAVFEEYQADFVVMKNSGERGGAVEKLEACRELNITPVIVERDDEEGFAGLEELAEKVEQGRLKELKAPCGLKTKR